MTAIDSAAAVQTDVWPVFAGEDSAPEPANVEKSAQLVSVPSMIAVATDPVAEPTCCGRVR
jgi:hypothetical protein